MTMVPVRRRFFAAFTALAFFAGALVPLLPERAAAAEPCAGMTGTASSHAPDRMMPNYDLGCCVAAALPAATAPVATPFAWAVVGYWTSAIALAGVVVSPDPSPPRSFV